VSIEKEKHIELNVIALCFSDSLNTLNHQTIHL